MQDKIARSSRFKRRQKRPPIQLTERDIEIIRQVHKHRFLLSKHIVALCSESAQNVLRRLQLLYHNGYLDRPRAQIEYYQRGGSKTMAYGLGNKGADLLSERFDIPRHKINWTAKNQSAKRLFLAHTLLISDVMVKMETACGNAGIRFIEQDEILAQCPVTTRGKRNPFKWKVRAIHEAIPQALAVHPDQVFGLRKPGRDPAYFFLEADRATMPVERSGLRRTSLFRKMLAYHESWKQGRHKEYFNFNRFCVLIVTTSQARIETIIEVNEYFSNGKGSRIFLFADKQAIVSGDILKAQMINGVSEHVSLLDII